MKKYCNVYFFCGIVFLILSVIWFTRMSSPFCGVLYALCAIINFINAYRLGKAENRAD